MTTTVLELIQDLKLYPDQTVITIKHVNDQEFAIVDFVLKNYTLSIVISEKKEEEAEAA